MKKFFLTAVAAMMAFFAQAQVVEVAGIERVALPEGTRSEIAVISPDGSYAVIGEMGATTLSKVDLTGGTTTVLTRNGNPQGVVISPDGQNIVFRTTTYNNRLRYTGLNSISVNGGAERVLVKPSRHLNAGVGISATGVTAVEGGKARVKNFGSSRAQSMPVASINYGSLEITVDGKTRTIDPQGRGSYLWPSISPDGTKVVYFLSGAGTFVCNLDGSDVRPLGHIRAARWLGNDKVVGMNDVDNGETLISSSIVASDLNGVHQTISPADAIAVFPSATADGSKVMYSTADGALYLINLK